MKPATKAVILARVSSKSQEDEGYSLDSQVKLLQSYCDNKGLVVAKTFKITESASKSSQRRIFKEAMAFIEEHGIKHLIIEKVDRHVRNLHDAVETHDWLIADENKQVHFVKDSLVMHKNSRSQEWLNWGIRVVMAKNYIDNLREEAMKGWAEKLAQGWLPAVPPPGYITVTENGKRIHVPEAKVSKLMFKVFRFYLNPGESLQSTADYMAKLGIVTRQGKPYAKSHLQRILMNPFYIGTNRFNGKDYPGAQETFIPKQLFKRVQEKMHGGRPRAYNKHLSPLQGVIRCEDCGSIVTWQLQKGHYYGVCRRLTDACKQGKMLREDYVEDMVVAELRKLVCPSPEIIDWVANAMREQYKDRIAERERITNTLHAQLARIGSMDETLYDDKLSGDISKERYDEKHAQFMTQKADIESQLETIDASMSERLEQRLVIFELSQKAADLYAKKTPEQKRLIISKLFEKLTLKGGAISVKYSKFAEAIADKVQITCNLMETQK
jgi:DNA invertase Pin-like site-specific DNA recombinase